MHLINTILALYKHARTRVLINGELSSLYAIDRGVCQGDSCYLFDLAIESLAQLLRDSNPQGLNIPNLPHHLIATFFADDTTVFLSSTDSYETLLSILAQWCHASSAKFNIQKTALIPARTAEYRSSVILTC